MPGEGINLCEENALMDTRGLAVESVVLLVGRQWEGAPDDVVKVCFS